MIPVMRDHTRRQALGCLGMAAIGGAFALAARAAQVRPPAGRRVIRTLGGDFDPATLRGTVLFHEHPSTRAAPHQRRQRPAGRGEWRLLHAAFVSAGTGGDVRGAHRR